MGGMKEENGGSCIKVLLTNKKHRRNAEIKRKESRKYMTIDRRGKQ